MDKVVVIVKEKSKQEFHVEILRSGYGFVKVRARSKNEAKRTVEGMNRQKMLGYYKENYEFVKIGEVTTAKPEND